MDYIKFADKFYKKYVLPLNSIGLKRTFENFHLVDMYPSIKAMDGFTNKKELVDTLRSSRLISNEASLYIHFPFCKNFCSYCHLYKENIYKKGNAEVGYVDNLIKEIDFYANISKEKITAKSIYFGGGTPSLMSVDSLKRILSALNNHFIINEDSFISFEVYPGVNIDEVVLKEKLKILKDFGAKEIVLDLQSTNDKSLKDIGRGDTNFIHWKKIIKIIKKAGINRIKTSLIIGLPFDDIKSFLKSINDISNTKEVTTVSLFLLEFREGLRVFDDLKSIRNKFCTETDRDKMQIIARRVLKDKGFYESPIHFFNRKKMKIAKSKKLALVDTNSNSLFGFGPSAYGHIITKKHAIKYNNCADLCHYGYKINNDDLPISRWKKLDKKSKIVSKLINDIYSDELINRSDIDKRLNKVFNVFIKLKLAEDRSGKVIFTELGKLRAEELLWFLYDKKYKANQKKINRDKDIRMHNYVTVVSDKDEKLFSNLTKKNNI